MLNNDHTPYNNFFLLIGTFKYMFSRTWWSSTYVWGQFFTACFFSRWYWSGILSCCTCLTAKLRLSKQYLLILWGYSFYRYNCQPGLSCLVNLFHCPVTCLLLLLWLNLLLSTRNYNFQNVGNPWLLRVPAIKKWDLQKVTWLNSGNMNEVFSLLFTHFNFSGFGYQQWLMNRFQFSLVKI